MQSLQNKVILPQSGNLMNIDLEQAVLVTLLSFKSGFDTAVLQGITERTFYFAANKIIYAEIAKSYANSATDIYHFLEIFIVSCENNETIKTIKNDDLGHGVDNISTYIERIYTQKEANIMALNNKCRELKKLETARHFMELNFQTNQALLSGEDPNYLLNKQTSNLSKINQITIGKITSSKDIVLKEFEKIENMDKGIYPIKNDFKFPFADVDFSFGKMAGLLGMSSMGKTLLMIESAIKIKKGFLERGIEKRVGIINLDSTLDELKNRFVANLSNLSFKGVIKPAYDNAIVYNKHIKHFLGENYTAYIRALNDFAELDILIETLGDRSFPNVSTSIHKLIAAGCCEIFVDYFQKIENKDGRKSNNTTDDLRDVILDLSSLISGYPEQSHLTLLLQPDSAIEKRVDKRPLVGDIARCKTDARPEFEVMLGIYRDEAYGIMEDEQGRSTKGVMEILNLKDKNGETNTKSRLDINLACYKINSIIEEENNTPFS